MFGSTFENCLHKLEKVLKRCIKTNLVLNWEKSHFMIREGIVLGHVVSNRGIEVDKAKVELISKLSPPTSVRQIWSFLGHAGFIADSSKTFPKFFVSCVTSLLRTHYLSLISLVSKLFKLLGIPWPKLRSFSHQIGLVLFKPCAMPQTLHLGTLKPKSR